MGNDGTATNRRKHSSHLAPRDELGAHADTKTPEEFDSFRFFGAPCSFASLRSPFGQLLAGYLPSLGSTKREGYFALLQRRAWSARRPALIGFCAM